MVPVVLSSVEQSIDLYGYVLSTIVEAWQHPSLSTLVWMPKSS